MLLRGQLLPLYLLLGLAGCPCRLLLGLLLLLGWLTYAAVHPPPFGAGSQQLRVVLLWLLVLGRGVSAQGLWGWGCLLLKVVWLLLLAFIAAEGPDAAPDCRSSCVWFACMQQHSVTCARCSLAMLCAGDSEPFTWHLP